MNNYLDIKKPMLEFCLNYARRLQSVVRDNQGAGLVKSVILFDSDRPVGWLEPKLNKLEPKSKSEMLLELLSR